MVRIITDTAGSMSVAEGAALGITVLPLTISLEHATYLDTVEITEGDFVKYLRSGKLATSSQPAPGLVAEAFESASAENPIVYVAAGDGLSGTYASACAVRSTMDNLEHIHVFDSRTVCGPEAAMARMAKRMADGGASVSEILAALEDASTTHKSYLIPQDLNYLKRGGRLTPAAAKVVGILGLLPTITQTPDMKRLEKAFIARGFAKVVEKCIEGFQRMGVDERYNITITHADNKLQALQARDKLRDAFPKCEYIISELPCALANQGGPMCVAIQACKR